MKTDSEYRLRNVKANATVGETASGGDTSDTSAGPDAACEDQRWSKAVTSVLRNASVASAAAAAGRHGDRSDSTSSEADEPATSSAFARNVRVAVSSEINAGSRSVSVSPRLWIPPFRPRGDRHRDGGGLRRVGRRAHRRAGQEGHGRVRGRRRAACPRAGRGRGSGARRSSRLACVGRPSRSQGAAESSSAIASIRGPSDVEALHDAGVRPVEAVGRRDGAGTGALRERAHEERVVVAVRDERGGEEGVARRSVGFTGELERRDEVDFIRSRAFSNVSRAESFRSAA